MTCVLYLAAGLYLHNTLANTNYKFPFYSTFSKRFLSIRQQGATPFANNEDSGSVIFEKTEGNHLLGVGLLFGILENQYHRYTMTAPLEIVLEALNDKLPDGSRLELVSNYTE